MGAEIVAAQRAVECDQRAYAVVAVVDAVDEAIAVGLVADDQHSGVYELPLFPVDVCEVLHLALFERMHFVGRVLPLAVAVVPVAAVGLVLAVAVVVVLAALSFAAASFSVPRRASLLPFLTPPLRACNSSKQAWSQTTTANTLSTKAKQKEKKRVCVCVAWPWLLFLPVHSFLNRKACIDAWRSHHSGSASMRCVRVSVCVCVCLYLCLCVSVCLCLCVCE